MFPGNEVPGAPVLGSGRQAPWFSTKRVVGWIQMQISLVFRKCMQMYIFRHRSQKDPYFACSWSFFLWDNWYVASFGCKVNACSGHCESCACMRSTGGSIALLPITGIGDQYQPRYVQINITLLAGWFCRSMVLTQEFLSSPERTNNLTGWWFGTFFIFPYIGNNDPNWLTHSFQRGRSTTNQFSQWLQLILSGNPSITSFTVPPRIRHQVPAYLQVKLKAAPWRRCRQHV